MSVFNSLVIVGNVTRDSEVRKFTKKDGTDSSVVTFGVANNRKVGPDKEEVLFLDVDYFGKEITLKKGQRVLLEGELRDGSYTNKEGVKVSKVKVIAHGVYEFSSAKPATSPAPESKKAPSTKRAVEEVSDQDIPL